MSIRSASIDTIVNSLFVDYVLGFYGKDGVYDFGATREEIIDATYKHIRTTPIPFEGDSHDREKVRDILMAEKGIEHF